MDISRVLAAGLFGACSIKKIGKSYFLFHREDHVWRFASKLSIQEIADTEEDYQSLDIFCTVNRRKKTYALVIESEPARKTRSMQNAMQIALAIS